MPADQAHSDRVQGALAWLALAAVCSGILALGANRIHFWTPLCCILLGLFAVQIVIDLRQPRSGNQSIWPAMLLYLGSVAWAAVQAGAAPLPAWAHPSWAAIGASGAISADPDASLNGVLRYAGYGCAFWIAAQSVRDTVRARQMVDAIALFAGALAVYGLGAWAWGQNPIVGEPAYPGVVTASFVNRNAYALFAAFGVMAAIAAFAMRLPDRPEDEPLPRGVALRELIETLTGRGALYALAALTGIAAMLLTGSRAGSLCGGLGILAVLWGTVGQRSGQRAVVFLMVLLVLASLAALPVLGARLSLEDPLTDQRMYLYALVWDGIVDRPWLGHGLGAFQDVFRGYVDARLGGAEWDLAHSSYLENAFELGLPAALALTIAVVIIAGQTRAGLHRRRRMRPLISLAGGIALAGGLHATIDFSLQMPALAMLFATMLGIGWGLATRPMTRLRSS